ncbi:MAG: electron transfer flavoprotein subunit beta/FixA family protein [Desulfobacterales bacterium]
MGIKMVVTVKQVPDTHNLSGDAMKPDGTVNRSVLPAIFNPEDLNALESALTIKDMLGGTVTAITMGPPSAREVLKECVYRGADEVILVSDRRFAGADTLATSYALTCAIEHVGQVDMVLCGRQAIDGDTAQVGPQIAEKLGWNQLTCVVDIVSVNEDAVTVRRVFENGYEIVKSRFPVLITVAAGANEPRYPSAKRVMAYKNLESVLCERSYEEAYMDPAGCSLSTRTKEWNVETIGADPELCGLSGSPTKVKKIENVVLTAGEARKIPNTPVGIASLIKELRDEHIIG